MYLLLFVVIVYVNVNAYPIADSSGCTLGDIRLSNNVIGNTLFFSIVLLPNTSCRNNEPLHAVVTSIDNNQVLGRSAGNTISLLGDGHCHTVLKVSVSVTVDTNETVSVATILYPMNNCLVCGDHDMHIPTRNITTSQEHSPL